MKCIPAVLTLLVIVAGCSKATNESRPAGEPASGPAASTGTGARPATDSSPAPSTVDPAGLAAVHEYTDMFYRGEIDLLFEKFSDEMREILPLEKLSALYEHAMTEYGKETGVIAEDRQAKDEYRGFVRWARFDKTDEIIEIQWILKADDTIAGFYIRPAPKKVRSEGTLEIQR